jgi:hypothetical protein
VYVFGAAPIAMVDGEHLPAVTECATSYLFCKVLICAAISGVSAVIRSAISGKWVPDLWTRIESRSGFRLSFGNLFASFGFAPITSPTTKPKKSESEHERDLEEPFDSWDV